MIKKLSVIVLISSSLFSQSFDEFLNSSIQNSPYLKSSYLSISQAKEQGSVLTRYKNPSLGLEYSEFNPKNGDNDNGYSVGISQPVRLWGVAKDTENFSDATLQEAKAHYSLSYAQFVHILSLQYTTYAEQKKLLNLGSEELEIAKQIYIISQERYKAGTIAKRELIQAQVDYEMVDIKIESLHLETLNTYYKLLEIAGVSKSIELDFTHEFDINDNSSSIQNPDLHYLEIQKRLSQADLHVNSHVVEFIDVFARVENEPEEDIFRVGFSTPLAIFNTKSQERQIAKLQTDKTELLMKNETAQLNMQHEKLEKQRYILNTLKSKNVKTLATQTKLLQMFEDGYKIANTNLLELQYIKNSVITSKENLIHIATQLHQNAIHTNYITGAYND